MRMFVESGATDTKSNHKKGLLNKVFHHRCSGACDRLLPVLWAA
jgi:hypothetical protein